jgi:hypothetical protein
VTQPALRSRSGGFAPATPGFSAFPARIARWLRHWGLRPQTPADGLRQGDGCTASPIPAAESALGLRPRIALSSAQVFPEWTTLASPCNDFSANGDYPLNFVSHSRFTSNREQK